MSALDTEATNRLRSAIRKVRGIVSRVQKLTEADTILHMILPTLQALGWQGFEHMRTEYPAQPAGQVDIALLCDNKPVLFVEAKSFKRGKNLNPKEAKQTVDYGTAAGVQWCLLTNGIVYQLYNNEWFKLPLTQRMVFETNVLEDTFVVVEQKLGLLSMGSVTDGTLQKQAQVQYATRMIQEWIKDPPDKLIECLHGMLAKAGIPRQIILEVLKSAISLTQPQRDDQKPPGKSKRGPLRYHEPVRIDADNIFVQRWSYFEPIVDREEHLFLGSFETALDAVCQVARKRDSFDIAMIASAFGKKVGGGSMGWWTKVATHTVGILWAIGLVEVIITRPNYFALTVEPDPQVIMHKVREAAETVA